MPERKVTYSETAPSNPNVGDGWIHTATRVEKIWNGTDWEPVLANLTQTKIWVGNASGKPTEENKPTGGGADTKSGQSTSPKVVEAQVNFTTPFSSTPRVVLTPTDNKGVWVTEVNVAYFKWNNDSKNTDVTVYWIATDA